MLVAASDPVKISNAALIACNKAACFLIVFCLFAHDVDDANLRPSVHAKDAASCPAALKNEM